MKCVIEDCSNKSRTRKMCKTHYARWYKHGTTSLVGKASKRSTKWRFDELVNHETNECIIWDGYKANGYGRIYFDGKNHLVHRLALEIRRGLAPINKPYALHKPDICHNPSCMNYRHLYWGDNADNIKDKFVDKTTMQGELHPRAKLTKEAVAEIRSSRLTDLQLSRKWGVDRKTVYTARNRLTWRHI